MSDNNIDNAKTIEDFHRLHSSRGISRRRARGQVHRYSLNEKDRIRRAIKRKKQRIIRMWFIIGCVMVLLVAIVALICKYCVREQKRNTELAGVWHYDQYTEYEFDGKGKGCMCLDGNNHFEFSYKTEGNALYLDFILDYVTDCQYSYNIEGEKLTLVGGEGTAEVGKKYELTKILLDK